MTSTQAKWPGAYPALSRYDVGTYGWAVDQLNAGNEVRREGWPIEIYDLPMRSEVSYQSVPQSVRIWKLYKLYGTDNTILQGFSNGVCGADNDSWGDLGMDSGCYTPSDADKTAKDWQTVSDVTPEQIKYLNEHRMQRYPNAYLQRYNEYERKRNWRVSINLALVACAVVGVIAYVLFKL